MEKLGGRAVTKFNAEIAQDRPHWRIVNAVD